MKSLSLAPFYLILSSFFFLLFSLVFVHAQEVILPQESYLLPRIVYVGDRARLVAQLGPAFNNVDLSRSMQFVQFAQDGLDFETAGQLPLFNDLVISSMQLESRNNSIQLVVDFVCYAPGLFVLPPLAITSAENETLLLGGLEINVASILGPERTAISLPALPLAFPGTGFLVYGTLGLVLVVLFLTVSGFLFAHKFLDPIRNRQKKRRLLASLEKTLAKLRADNINNDAETERELFSLLAQEFRDFLSFVTNVDCRVLAPAEFYNLPLALPEGSSSSYLCALFRRWDTIRFSGTGMARNDVLSIVNELGAIIPAIANPETDTGFVEPHRQTQESKAAEKV